MKILHLIDSGGLYGAETMLVSLAVQQMKNGHEVVIGSIRKPGLAEKPLEKAARLKGVTVHLFEMKPGVNLVGAVKILRLARRRGFDVIHSHGYKSNILIGFLPRSLRRVPVVSTLHGWTSPSGWTKMRFNELLDSVALRFVDRIVLVSHGMLEKKRVQGLPDGKVRVVNNGIDITMNQESDIERVEACADTIRDFTERSEILLTSIGRLSPEKGFDTLIDATARLRHEFSLDVRLMLVGDGRLREELTRRAEDAGLGEGFLITGYVENARELIALADIYVISSLTEGLPITLLEAMAAERAIVATSVGGIPAVVEHERDALLVPPQSADAIADAVMYLLDNADHAARMVRSSSEKVRNTFSSEAMMCGYAAIYKEVI